MLPFILTAIGGYLIGDSMKSSQTFAEGGQTKYGYIPRFDRHKEMDGDTRKQILDAIADLDDTRLENYLYGLFDGYDYSGSEKFKESMADLKKKDSSLHNRIESIYSKIDKYEKYADGGLLKLYNLASERQKLLNSLMIASPDKKKDIQKKIDDIEAKMDQVKPYADGGSIAESNNRMLRSKVKEVKHHADELDKVVKPKTEVEGWVVAKAERSASDLSDITHYLDGRKFAKGGEIYKLGDTWSPIFDYDGMLETALTAKTSWGVKKLQKLYDSLEDVNYHTANRPLGEVIEALKKDMPNVADIKMEEFHEAIKKEMA
jgi:hypothetical protein